jgi:serine protease Do
MKKFLLGLVLISVSAFAGAKELPDFTELVTKEGPAVVNISTTQTVTNEAAMPQVPGVPKGDPLYDFLRRFGLPQGHPQQFESHSLGSGFIISSDGYILPMWWTMPMRSPCGSPTSVSSRRR